jgi:hypothetical protein
MTSAYPMPEVRFRSALVGALAARYDMPPKDIARAIETATQMVRALPDSEPHFDALVASCAHRLLFKRSLTGV